MRIILTIALAALAALPTSRQPGVALVARRPAADLDPTEVNAAIDKAISFLKSRQRGGNWETRAVPGYPGGTTCLTMLALLEAGVDPSDRTIQEGLRYVRKLESSDTYVVSLQIMVLSKASPMDDLVQIKKLVDWLKQKRHYEGNAFAGWGYGHPQKVPGQSDNSNTQYAVLALWFASQAGVPIEADIWKDIREYYIASQLPRSGGWTYRGMAHKNPLDERLTMTAAGVCGLLIADMELAKLNAEKNPNQGCGPNVRNAALENGLRRFGEQFAINYRQTNWQYYHLYGVERTGRLSGQRFFTARSDAPDEKHDWYRAGVRFLMQKQDANGFWSGEPDLMLATSFALLFLAKGRTPVLMHKMTTGLPAESRTYSGDWNQARNDVRNLTEFCSQNVFKRNGRPVPLTWQIFDAARQELDDSLVQDLLQAPIVYFNGSRPPEFTKKEEILLQRYVEQGGFIIAEGLRGDKQFVAGFRALAKKLWPDRELTPIDNQHALWTAAFPVAPGSFKLEGIDFGCKLGVLLVADDLACHWESNRYAGPATDRSVQAFRMGANIVAYVTGLEPPDYKLARKALTGTKEDPITRNYLQAAQINYGGPDWQPAPQAMRAVMDNVSRQHGVDVISQTKALTPDDANLPNFKFLYMHGRREFTITPEDQKRLRQHLEIGGFLLADACCGAEAFDKKFEEFIAAMFGRALVDVPADDAFYAERYGKAIKSVMCRTQRGAPYQSMTPQLRGLRLDPANPASPWIVLYSKYDLGCALSKHQSGSCLGHNHESALDLATQAVLYALRE